MNFRKHIAWLVFFCFLLPGLNVIAAENEIKIGILAKRGTEKALQRWQPTADFLNESLPNYRFTIVPMLFDEIPILVRNRLVDFVAVNPAIYVDLSVRFDVRRIVTLKNRLSKNHDLTLFGSVIFSHSGNKDFSRLTDLKGKKIAAVHPTSLGGWIMAMREIKDAGLSEKDFSEVIFTDTHDAVVESVLTFQSEIGVVRTDTLERMAAEGKADLTAIKVINQQNLSNFPLLVSTRLYPEWPFSKLAHTSDELSKDVALALMSMSAESPAAQAANIKGWTIAENYLPVHEMLQQMALRPYEGYNQVSIPALIRSYWHWILMILMLMISLTGLALGVVRLNSRLRQNQIKLKQSEALARTTFERAAVGITHATTSGVILQANRAFSQITGYTEYELKTLNFNDIFVSGNLTEKNELFKKLKQGKLAHFTLQHQYLQKNGHKIWARTTISHVHTTNGGMDFLIAVSDDISDQIQMEQQMQAAQKQKELVLNMAGDGILGLGLDGAHSFVNPAAAKMLGYEIEEMLGHKSHPMWHHSRANGNPFPESDCPITSVLHEGIIHRGQNETFWRKDGTTFQVEFTSTPIFEEHQITGAVVVFRPVNDKASEAERPE